VGDDFGVVDEPVDHGSGDGLVAEDLPPRPNSLVAGHDQRDSLIAGPSPDDLAASADAA
jgi:hypothetical protein